MKNIKVAYVIPCFNEATRLNPEPFVNYVAEKSEVSLCFVNDGSSDDTLSVLKSIQRQNPDQIHVLSLEKNSGKAEAVRQGVLHMLEETSIYAVGYMDADLSTGFAEMENLYRISENFGYQEMLVFGSRQKDHSEGIQKSLLRHLAGRLVAAFTRSIHRLEIYDTQCGAKVFSRGMANMAFKKSFKSSWLFDVEIFIRIRNYYSVNNAQMHIKEVPLNSWVHQEGSKITLKDSMRIPLELNGINMSYNVAPRLNAAIQSIQVVAGALLGRTTRA